ncbi:MAG: hypothetical protein HETSPECPRED_000770 [Heterodermia speciosa]|uniref:Uncharacterized protein n=1 Tax=Heterodermia speciosa TaxID=116794 RepID=A0A8H3GD59_9LECA|nr:MAG: hypothetical protein HETSPECPRED_000770 [Heterodermia speciosa]
MSFDSNDSGSGEKSVGGIQPPMIKIETRASFSISDVITMMRQVQREIQRQSEQMNRLSSDIQQLRAAAILAAALTLASSLAPLAAF